MGHQNLHSLKRELENSLPLSLISFAFSSEGQLGKKMQMDCKYSHSEQIVTLVLWCNCILFRTFVNTALQIIVFSLLCCDVPPSGIRSTHLNEFLRTLSFAMCAWAGQGDWFCGLRNSAGRKRGGLWKGHHAKAEAKGMHQISRV